MHRSCQAATDDELLRNQRGDDSSCRIVKPLASERSSSLQLKHSWVRRKFNLMAEGVERSDFRRLGAHAIPEGEADHFFSIWPFK